MPERRQQRSTNSLSIYSLHFYLRGPPHLLTQDVLIGLIAYRHLPKNLRTLNDAQTVIAYKLIL